MFAFIVHRLIQGIIVMFLVSYVTFGILQLAPGSPIDTMVGEAPVTKAQRAAIAEKWGLDKPWYQQYWTWMSNVFTGDLGTSVVRTGTPVSEMIREAAPVTLKLNAIALLISVLVALPVGLISAIRRYSWFDNDGMVGSTLGVSVTNFWISLMLIYFFSLKLGWLPPYGMETWKGWVLPVGVLAAEQMAVLARLTRGATLEVLTQDYVTTARAKGLMERTVVLRHALRNSINPVISIIGLELAALLGGTVIVETIFNWPGLSSLLISGVRSRDYPVVQGTVLLICILTIVINLVVDVTYGLLDPRIRHG